MIYVRFKQVSYGDSEGKGISGRGNIMCKGSEEGRNLYSENIKTITVHKVGQGGGDTRHR